MKRTVHPKELKELLSRKNHILLIDAQQNRSRIFSLCHTGCRMAQSRNSQWSEELSRGKEVVIYCARGGSVSNKVLDHLRSKKINARYIEGGVAAWKASGGTTEYRK